MLKGKKVFLRPVKKSDLSVFLKWFNDLEVIQYLGSIRPITEIEEERWIEELGTIRKESDIVFVIEAVNSKKPIGTCGFHHIDYKNQNADFGIAIGEKRYWNKGYGTEAAELMINYGFTQLNLNRISSAVFDFNERSIKLHKKVGFQEEGRWRKYVFKNGRFHDSILFGLLREEWKERRKIS